MPKKYQGNCKHCGRSYIGFGKKYCSVECSSQRRIGTKRPFRPYRERIVKKCEHCGDEMQLTPYEATWKRYCSRECGNKSRRRKEERTCLSCGKTFWLTRADVNRGRGKYCSKECYGKAVATKIAIVCEQCGKQFEAWPSNAKDDNGRYCSQECSGLARRNRVNKTCKNCGAGFEVKASTVEQGEGLYCSRKCALASRGETVIERLVREELERLGIEFEQEKPMGRYVIDFYLPHQKIAIEADGNYWHSLEKAKDTAKRKNKYLDSRGIKVFRLKEDEIKQDVAAIVASIL